MIDYVELSDAAVDGELVVDLRYQNLVIDRLRQLETPVTVVHSRENETLDLALLSLRGVGKIDTVLAELRSWFTENFGGWVPALEDNHVVHGIVGFPESKPMAGGKLTVATADEWQRSSDQDAGRGVRVGVLDTGLFAHEDLADKYKASSGNLYVPPPDHPVAAWAGHATAVTGLIAAQAPAAEIIVHRVLRSEDGRASVWDTAVAMVELANANLDVLNCSLGCRTGGAVPLALQRAVEVLSRQTLIVAAAGNHGEMPYNTLPTWPAALPGVIAVGAAKGPFGAGTPALAPISPRLPWVDVVAPGFAVVSTYLYAEVVTDAGPVQFKGFARWSGTSFATASASGAIAAQTVPGEISAKGALVKLLSSPNEVVREYVWPS